MEIVFDNPVYLWFLFIIPILILAHFFSLKLMKRNSLKFANFPAIENALDIKLLSKNFILLIINILIIIFLTLSIAGTTVFYIGESSESNFILAVDVSSSMLADDFNPNRLEAAKETALEFVENIPINTKMGIIAFSGASLIKLKPSTKKSEINDAITNLEIERIGGTAIGEVIISATNLLLLEEDKPKSIIVLTDGQSNVGAPVNVATDYAIENGVTIYTIGIGTEEGGKFKDIDAVSKLDEQSLINIAEKTSGSYYKAENKESISNAYKDIITLKEQKIPIEISRYSLIAALVLFLIMWFLINSKFRTIP